MSRFVEQGESERNVVRAKRSLRRSDSLLNDRREYMVDDLERAYRINHAEAVALHAWIQERCYGKKA